MRKLLQRLRPSPPELDPALWAAVRLDAPWIAALDEDRAARLRALTARFLHQKTITPLAGLALDPAQRALLAALCCLPLLEFGIQGLRGWSQLLVYPDAFRVNRTHVDAAGVMHEWDDELIGEAWESGPVILSWADVQADLAKPDAGFCVAAHEIAHKLDALDGLLDGTPPLPRDWQRQWAHDFQAAYDALCAQVLSGRETAIDDYAAEAPEEFFAVASEYHFSAPALLRESMPQVAAHLTRFYGPSPFASAL
ncbi:zinc-dependent peptidase [Luteimonas sp. SX5]|uniref:Zinc-dependent peptidase n=1 Tax=Luteimonas galliterrae TaxID=2940486 RepID=A0ABT0MIK8_9GAMM|nr:M90 family metallopeptidase [Luteimonas galliterrae]MCL1634704.1 zinc-dependent peptidase [Luteimonas galliterrae]